ncbi:MAG: B12-binding domain-containing radical SAM protein [bacterium]
MNFFKKHSFDRKRVFENVLEMDNILGIVYRECGSHGREIFTGKRPFVDLDELPLPARDLLPMDKYIPFPVQYRRLPVVHLFVSRGCPWHCSFCCTPVTWGTTVRFRSPAKVVEEIKHVMEKYGAREISFWDDTFTANAEWLTELCDRIQDEKIDIIWSCFARANDMKPALAKKMKEGGCWEVFMGIESINQDSLNAIRKGLKPKIIEKGVKVTQEAGIEVRGLFMLGLPKETPQKALSTIDFAIELDLDYAQFTLTTPHKGTDLYAEAPKFGTLVVDEESSRNTQTEAVFVPEGYENADELNNIVKFAYKKFYMRPRYWWKKVKSINTVGDFNRYYQGFKIAARMINLRMENWKSDMSEEVEASLRSH